MLESNSINFNFFADLDGFYDVSQSICLREKEISQDKQLSSKITELESRIIELETKEIIKEVQGPERVRIEEVIKYIESCPVPKEIINIHNDAALLNKAAKEPKK